MEIRFDRVGWIFLSISLLYVLSQYASYVSISCERDVLGYKKPSLSFDVVEELKRKINEQQQSLQDQKLLQEV